MSTSKRISRLLARLQTDPLTLTDLQLLIGKFGTVCMLIARSGSEKDEKERMIEEQRGILLRVLREMEEHAIARGTLIPNLEMEDFIDA